MQRPNLYDYLKILAIITMIVDHVGFLFFPEQAIWRIIGRTAFPLFLFLVGYNHSYRRKSSLWVWGILLQIGLWIGRFYGLTDMWYINILLAIGGTRVVMRLIQKYNSIFIEGVIFVTCLLLGWYTYEYIDYGTLSIVFALLGYWARKYGNILQVKCLIAFSVGYHLIFMFFTRQFDGYILLLSIVGVLLYTAMYFMSKSNYTLKTSNQTYNTYITNISTHALEIYILQAVVLTALYVL